MDIGVRFERRAQLGHVVLDRPKAINALTHEMVIAITEKLRSWADDDSVATVLLTGAGERGLCAGGDIVGLYRAATEGDPDAAARFWADEYRLDALIARYPKPFVAYMDGIVLGGGVGLSAHAAHRIVTERSSVGLPEVGIGFVPDVGSTWLLSRSPGELGTHVALTGRSVGPGDAVLLGLADGFLPTDRDLTDAPDGIQLETPPEGELAAMREWIDEAYAGDDARVILERLEASPLDAAKAAAEVIRTKSPTAIAVTLAALRRARELPSLEHVLDQDFRVSVHALAAPDFAEGVRAQVIDKDRQPRWNPATIPAPEDIQHYFDPVAGGPALATQGSIA
jgi:enoyl-CoA hydratase